MAKLSGKLSVLMPAYNEETIIYANALEAARQICPLADDYELLVIDEGLCAQIMHLGPYDDEPATVALLDAFVAEQGLENDMSDSAEGRHHHEIYLSDPRRTAPEKLKTVLRHPVRARD